MTVRAGLVFAIAFAALATGAAQALSPLETGLLRTLNRLRDNPAGYIPVLRQERQYYQGKIVEVPGQPDLITQEGVRPLDEAIRALQAIRSPRGRLTLSVGLSRAAAEHVRDMGRIGLLGHDGSDGSHFAVRLDRYGTWSGEIGEAIGYGPNNARDMITDLLIDDGVPDRGHRKNLLDPTWHYVGIACGPHARYGTMCVIDFAVNYRDRRLQRRPGPTGFQLFP